MKEFVLPLNKAFSVGLRKDHRVGFNLEAFELLTNLKPMPFGLATVNEVVNYFGLVVDWPFPQLFYERGDFLIALQNQIYHVTEGAARLKYMLKDYYSPLTNTSIWSGGPWHHIDLGIGWILTNGVSVVSNLGMSERETIYEQHEIPVSTGCEFRGRVFFGGFDQQRFWCRDWDNFWQVAAEAVNNTNIAASLNMNANFVWWSSIGGGDVMMLFDKEKMLNGPAGSTGYNEEDNPYILEILRRNEMGFMPMSFPGSILNMKPLQSGVMVYGEHGISMLTPVSSPAPTMSLKHITNQGIASRSAVGGSLFGHVFVDPAGYLWFVKPDGQVERLGYQEYFYPMLGTDIVVTYNPHESEYYICNAGHGYVLNGSGLAKVSQQVSSLVNYSGAIVGTRSQTDLGNVSFTTDKFNFGLPGMKLIGYVEIESFSMQSVKVRLIYFIANEKYYSNWVEVIDGAAYLGISAEVFQIQVQGSDLGGGSFTGLNVKWKKVDLRFQRGLSVGADNVS